MKGRVPASQRRHPPVFIGAYYGPVQNPTLLVV